jgi:hypothetical protein
MLLCYRFSADFPGQHTKHVHTYTNINKHMQTIYKHMQTYTDMYFVVRPFFLTYFGNCFSHVFSDKCSHLLFSDLCVLLLFSNRFSKLDVCRFAKAICRSVEYKAMCVNVHKLCLSICYRNVCRCQKRCLSTSNTCFVVFFNCLMICERMVTYVTLIATCFSMF